MDSLCVNNAGRNDALTRVEYSVLPAIKSALAMPLLSFDDAGVYYSQGLVSPEKIPSTIAFLTGIVEGINGAQRSLEQQGHSENQVLHRGQKEYFVRCWPLNTLATVEIKRREWEVIETAFDDRSIFFDQPMRERTQIRVTYNGGFNFLEESLDVEQIKSALGQLLEYHAINMGASTARIQSEDIYQESKIAYFVDNDFPPHLLAAFHKYRPYLYRF